MIPAAIYFKFKHVVCYISVRTKKLLYFLLENALVVLLVFFHARCKAVCLSVAMATATFWFQLFITLHPSLEAPPPSSSAARVTLIWSEEVVFGY